MFGLFKITFPFSSSTPSSSLSKPNPISSFPPPPFLLPLLPPSLSLSISFLFPYTQLTFNNTSRSNLWTCAFATSLPSKFTSALNRTLSAPVQHESSWYNQGFKITSSVEKPWKIPSIPSKVNLTPNTLVAMKYEDNHLRPHVVVQERIRTGNLSKSV